MRQLLPEPVDRVDPLECYLADERPASAGRPWLMVNMIASADGATALDGTSGGLGGPADKAVFRAVRASCDWVLVASATANAERYRLPHLSAEASRARAAHGREGTPRLAIVTASGRVDPTMPALAAPSGDAAPALVLTGTEAVIDEDVMRHAEVERLATPTPEPAAVAAALAARGATVVLAEGGPTFNGLLHAAGMVDELCLSISPTLAGGPSSRIIAGDRDGHPIDLELTRLLEQDGLLFARYVRG